MQKICELCGEYFGIFISQKFLFLIETKKIWPKYILSNTKNLPRVKKPIPIPRVEKTTRSGITETEILCNLQITSRNKLYNLRRTLSIVRQLSSLHQGRNFLEYLNRFPPV